MFFFEISGYIEIVGKQREQIWNPIIKFSNLKKYEQTKYYGGMNTFSFWYNGSQTMMYGEEFQLMFSCYFDFPEYPFEVPYSRHYKRQLIFFQPTFVRWYFG